MPVLKFCFVLCIRQTFCAFFQINILHLGGDCFAHTQGQSKLSNSLIAGKFLLDSRRFLWNCCELGPERERDGDTGNCYLTFQFS